MIEIERITDKNIDLAVKIHSELFPGYSALKNYTESIANNSYYEYYLLKIGEKIIGITGIYSYPQYPDSAWLGWFGIRKPYRRMHYGQQTIQIFEKMAIKKGFKFARLYTDKYDNDSAISFYEANGYTKEDYMNEDDIACKKYPILIFSKSLSDNSLLLWDNKNIYLTDQIEKQTLS